jgi:hypothetical protein
MSAVPQPTPIDAVPPPTRTPWREGALTRATELRGRLAELLVQGGDGPGVEDVAEEVRAHVTAAEQAVAGTARRPLRHALAAMRGASVERANSQLDAAEAGLLRMAPTSYLVGQLPAILARARAHLPADDPRLQRLVRIANDHAETLAPADDRPLPQVDREAVIATLRAATLEERREVARVRSFRNILLCAALALAVCAGGLLVVGMVEPRAVPLCFTPGNAVVCPTHTKATGPAVAGGEAAADAEHAERLDGVMRDTASAWDIAVVELIGLVAAAVAAAASLRKMEGTSTPYSLPTALAVLKLPTGALTAVLGLMLIRGAFIPGLSALDTSGQIVAWAVIFGYAQQVFTRFVDDQAKGVLDDVGTVDKAKAKGITVNADARAGTP